MSTKPQILNKEIVAASRLYKIETLQLHFSNGEERKFERIRGKLNGAVMIVPLLDRDTILLIREYAAGVEDYVLAFPKGAVENGEDLYATANRELMEEVGFGAKHFEYLAKWSTSPNYMTSMMHIVLAQELYPQRLLGDEPEPIEVIPWKLNQVDSLLSHPQFHEARSVAALLLLQRQGYGSK